MEIDEMGLFSKQKNKAGQDDNYKLLTIWLDNILQKELPEGIAAFNINLYEGSDATYDLQLIGSDKFDDDVGDWACTEYFSSGEDICYIKRTKDIQGWEKGLDYITKLVEQYLNEGRNAHILKNANAVGIGFVDGDIDIIYHAK